VIARGLLGAGAAGVVLGELWGTTFPINKALWTSSYAVLTAGVALLGLGVCVWLVEVRGWRRWARPLVACGVNALALFFLSTLVARLLIAIELERPAGPRVPVHALLFEHGFAPWARPIDASLAWALVYLALWGALAWWLDRRHLRFTV
jgi:predicted acyltransferase